MSESELDWEVRPYEEGDASSVRTLLTEAFETAAEAELAEALRADGDAEVEMVAEADGQVIGYIVLSPMSAPERALGLGPVATRPNYEGHGVASSLIETGLAIATANGFTTVFLLGDPAFYERFGFSVDDAAKFSSAYAGPYWQVTFLDDEEAPKSGEASYAPAFKRFED